MKEASALVRRLSWRDKVLEVRSLRELNPLTKTSIIYRMAHLWSSVASGMK